MMVKRRLRMPSTFGGKRLVKWRRQFIESRKIVLFGWLKSVLQENEWSDFPA
jgi:hypothetical protein